MILGLEPEPVLVLPVTHVENLDYVLASLDQAAQTLDKVQLPPVQLHPFRKTAGASAPAEIK